MSSVVVLNQKSCTLRILCCTLMWPIIRANCLLNQAYLCFAVRTSLIYSPLICSVNLRVLLLLVFIIRTLRMHLSGSLICSFIASPLYTFFQLALEKCETGLFLLCMFCTMLRTTGGWQSHRALYHSFTSALTLPFI